MNSQKPDESDPCAGELGQSAKHTRERAELLRQLRAAEGAGAEVELAFSGELDPFFAEPHAGGPAGHHFARGVPTVDGDGFVQLESEGRESWWYPVIRRLEGDMPAIVGVTLLGLKFSDIQTRERGDTPEEHLWCLALAFGYGEWECCDGTPVDLARHVTAVQRAIEDGRRQAMLRDQAVAVAEERTRERDKLRAAMPAGLAFELLIAQERRLRRTKCPTMSFDPSAGPVEMIAAVKREIAELEAEEPGTDAWRSEALDVFSCALHLLIAADMTIDDALAAQASKLGARLDHIDGGGTWEGAKEAERGDACTHPAEAENGGCCVEIATFDWAISGAQMVLDLVGPEAVALAMEPLAWCERCAAWVECRTTTDQDGEYWTECMGCRSSVGESETREIDTVATAAALRIRCAGPLAEPSAVDPGAVPERPAIYVGARVRHRHLVPWRVGTITELVGMVGAYVCWDNNTEATTSYAVAHLLNDDAEAKR
jgi:hypothetical protein